MLRIRQESVELSLTGDLNEDSAGYLRAFLWTFTVEGGPRELVLELGGVITADEYGMMPIWEAHDLLSLRNARLRLRNSSAEVTRLLAAARSGVTFLLDRNSELSAPHDAGLLDPAPTGADDDRPPDARDS